MTTIVKAIRSAITSTPQTSATEMTTHTTVSSQSTSESSASSTNSSSTSTSTSTSTPLEPDPPEYISQLESMIETLDTKRLQLLQLIKTHHNRPYSTRSVHSMANLRHESARLSRRIHHRLMRISAEQVHHHPEILKCADNYAHVSMSLNKACIESVELEEKQQQAKPSGRSPSSSPSITPNLTSQPHSNVGMSVFALDPVPGHIHERTRRRDRVDAKGKVVWTEGEESGVTDVDTDAEDGIQPLLFRVDAKHDVDAATERAEARSMEYAHLATQVREVTEMFAELKAMVQAQQEDLDVMEDHIESANERVHDGEKDLIKASRYKAFGLTVIGSVAGALVGGPIGAVLVGSKLATLGLGMGGAVAGYGASHKIAASRRREADLAQQAQQQRQDRISQPSQSLQSDLADPLLHTPTSDSADPTSAPPHISTSSTTISSSSSSSSSSNPLLLKSCLGR